MNTDLPDYPAWVGTLERWGLSTFAAVLLEAAAPLHIFAAQVIYVGEPLLNGLIPRANLRSVARMLEDPRASAEFVRRLRQAG